MSRLILTIDISTALSLGSMWSEDKVSNPLKQPNFCMSLIFSGKLKRLLKSGDNTKKSSEKVGRAKKAGINHRPATPSATTHSVIIGAKRYSNSTIASCQVLVFIYGSVNQSQHDGIAAHRASNPRPFGYESYALTNCVITARLS